jgi:hypothetical protein
MDRDDLSRTELEVLQEESKTLHDLQNQLDFMLVMCEAQPPMAPVPMQSIVMLLRAMSELAHCTTD